MVLESVPLHQEAKECLIEGVQKAEKKYLFKLVTVIEVITSIIG